MKLCKYLLAVMLAATSLLSYAGDPSQFGGWTYGGTDNHITGVINTRGVVTPSTTNYSFWSNGTNTSLNGSSGIFMKTGGTAIFGFGNNSLFSAGVTGNVLISQILPTIASGCGTSPTISTVSTAAGAVTIGSSPGSTCVLTLPTASHGWDCQATDITTQFDTKPTTVSTTSVTFTNYTRGTTTPVAFTASDVVQFMCMGY